MIGDSMPPKRGPDAGPTFSSSESEGLRAAALVCRVAADGQERDDLLDMLGLGSMGELRVRLMRREAERLRGEGHENPVFNHYPMHRS